MSRSTSVSINLGEGRGQKKGKIGRLLRRKRREASISTLVSNPKIWIMNPKNWILQACQSLLSTEKQFWSVIPFSTPLTSFVDLIKVYQYRQVDITEDRGTPYPYPTDQGGEGNMAALADGEGRSSACFRPLLS